MKKLFSFLVTFLVTSSLWAANFTLDNIIYRTGSDSTVQIYDVSNTSISGELIIPSQVVYNGTTYQVVGILGEAFSYCSYTSIELPNSITSVVGGVFYGCDDLKKITLPEKITSLGWSSHGFFEGCSSLESISIPDNVKTIGQGAFYGCTSLTSITLPANITTIATDAFYGCTNISKVNHMGDVKSWCKISFRGAEANPVYYSKNLFINDEEVKDLVIPNSVLSINNYAFINCKSITSVDIPNSVTEIGMSAFFGCESLTSIVLPKSIQSVGKDVFSGCSLLESITVPSHLYLSTSSSTHYFSNCFRLKKITIAADLIEDYCNSTTNDNLYNVLSQDGLVQCERHLVINGEEVTNLVIPNTIQKLGERVFYGLSNIDSITLPNSLTSIATNTFEGCSGIKSVTWDITQSTYSLDNVLPSATEISEIHLGDHITTIPKDFCVNREYLQHITIGKNVTSIAANAFSNCKRLNSIKWNAKKCNNWLSHSGAPFYSMCAQIENFEFGEGVEVIPYGLCYKMEKLQSITLPSSLEEIDWLAFDGCSGIKTITIPNGVTAIGKSAFYGCSNLSTITLPNKITSIEENTFTNCESLTSIEIPNSVTNIGDKAFYKCTALTAINIPNSVTNIGSQAFRYCTSFTSVTVPNSISYIGPNAFGNLTNLSTINWNVKSPTGYYEEGGSTYPIFYGCPNVTTVNLSEDVIEIPKAFCYGMEQLASIDIPNSVKTIGEYAFQNCSSLTTFTFGENIATIEPYVFSGCTNLKHVNWNVTSHADFYRNSPLSNSSITSLSIGENVKRVPAYLCYWLENLKNVTIGDNVTSIGERAFYWCESLASIEIPNSVTSIDAEAFNGCESLTTITIPANTTTIGKKAFAYCDSLTTINWNPTTCSGFTEYNDDNEKVVYPIFSGCYNVKTIHFSDDVLEIPECLCKGMSRITSIKLPNSLTGIRAEAFSGCSSLTSIELPNSVKNIFDKAFYGCSSLSSLAIGKNVQRIANGAFSLCTNITSIVVDNENTTYDSRDNCNAIISTSDNTLIVGCQNTIIPQSVSGIGDNAFYGCTGLKSINIGENIASIGEDAFYGCSGLNTVVWDTKKYNTDYSSPIEPPFYIGDGFAPISSFTFGDNVGHIPAYLCSRLPIETLIMGKNIKSIGESAFERSPYIKYIELPNTVKTIGDYAFARCESLDSIKLSNALTAIPEHAFQGSYNLKSIEIPNSVKTIGRSAFESCEGLTTIEIPNSVTLIDTDAFNECTELRSAIVGENVREVGARIFAECENLTSVEWNAISCQDLDEEDEIFGGATIQSITFGEKVQNIPSFICCEQSEIETINLPNTVTSIGDYAFAFCENLKTINIPNIVKNIGMMAFCATNIESITIPTKTILNGAFSECSNLMSVTLLEDVSLIENGAFYACDKLEELICYSSIPPMTNFAEDEGFSSTNYNRTTVYVPCDYLEEYKADSIFGAFKNIECIESKKIKTNSVSVTTDQTTATFSWPKETNAERYTLEIYQNDEIFCSLNFSATGQLLNVAYAPGRNGNRAAAQQSAGYRFTVEGLTADTEYFYDLMIVDSSNHPLKSYSGNFATGGNNLGSVDFVTIREITCGSYVWNGQEITQSGTYGDTLQNIYGNDSIITLELTVLPEAIVNEYNITINENELPFSWRGQEIYSAGIYTDVIPYANAECDSAVFTLYLKLESSEVVDNKCGENLYWEFASGALIIIGAGDMYDYTSSSMPWKQSNNEIRTILLPESMTNIGAFAFADCYYLPSITIPATVNSIGNGAFENCRLLSTISFANNGQLTTIGSWAFYNCHELKDVVIPEGVTEIGHAAFYGCTYLKDLTLPASLQSIADNGFAGCSKLVQIQVNAIIPPQVDARTFEDVDRSIPVIVPDESVEQYKSAPVWKEFNVRGKIGTGVENITSTTNNVQKIIRDNQLFIIRDGKMYGIMGQEIK